MAEQASRQELSQFLKTRRARLAPADVGLPAGNGRRIAGLRREEVAVLAGVGLTWYTWLEQGRPIQVSTPFLENLARALRLSEAERAHLFALAQHRAPPMAPQPSPPEALKKVQAILDAIDSPAYARNSRFDVLAWNGANTRMFGDFASMPQEERNLIRLMFSRPYHRRAMVNWEQDARNLVAKFRLSYGQAAPDAAFSSLVQDMMECSTDFRRMWADHEVTDIGEGVYVYRTRRHGTLAFQHSTLVPEVLPDLRIVIYLPAKRPGE
jgi:transcriptional regulator with XRE-family HTH domain